MLTFDLEKGKKTAFDLGDTYITYFDKDLVFNQLQKHHKVYKYEFEVSDSGLEKVEQLLDKYYYEPQMTDDFEDFCVMAEKGTDSSDVLRSSIIRKQRVQNEIFVMENERPVNQSVEQRIDRIKNPGPKGGAGMETSPIVTGPVPELQVISSTFRKGNTNKSF